jgi:hypothetical protein
LLESASPAFSISNAPAGDVHLSLCNVIVDLVVSLAGVVLKDFTKTRSAPEVKKAVSMIVNKLGAYFPFGHSNEIRGQRVSLRVSQVVKGVEIKG